MNPPIRWPGTKQPLVTSLVNYLPVSITAWHEAFFTDGALFFHEIPPTGTLNCANEELYLFYTVVRHNCNELLTHARRHEVSVKYYKQYESLLLSSMTALQRASRFFYFNRVYKAQIREKKEVEHPHIFGQNPRRIESPKARWLNCIDAKSMWWMEKDLQKFTLHFESWDEYLLRVPQRGEFCLIAPVCDTIKKKYLGYTLPQSWSNEEQKKLPSLLRTLNERGVLWMLLLPHGSFSPRDIPHTSAVLIGELGSGTYCLTNYEV